MSHTRDTTQSDLFDEIVELMARCLGIIDEEPKHMPGIRVKAMGSGVIITLISPDENATILDLQLIVADRKNVHNTMIGFTEGHGGPIIDDNSRYLSSFPENTVFVSYVKNAKCRFRNRLVCTGECQIYNEYGVPLCLCCYNVRGNHIKFARLAHDNRCPWEDYTYHTVSNIACNEHIEYPSVPRERQSVPLERPSVPIEQLFGASYTSSRSRKTSKSQQTTWYNNNKPVNDVRIQKRTKKSHR
jgi:hypothetical protein